MRKGITMVKIRKNVIRETAAEVFECGKLRAVVVTIRPKVVSFRLKGTFRSYDLPISKCFFLAVLAAVEAEKTALRKQKKA